MLSFEPDYLDKINAQYEGGKWLKTAIVTESISPLVKRYWVDHEDQIIYGGNTYDPLPMYWEGIKTSVGMPTEGASVALSNLGNIVWKYMKVIDPSAMPVVLQLLHLDLLSIITRPYERYYKVRNAKGDQSAVLFTLGRELGQNKLPRRVIMPEEMT